LIRHIHGDWHDWHLTLGNAGTTPDQLALAPILRLEKLKVNRTLLLTIRGADEVEPG